MFIEHIVAATEGRKAGVAILCAIETMLRAFSVTYVGELAAKALGWKSIALFEPESILFV